MQFKVLLGGINLLSDTGQYASEGHSAFSGTPFSAVWRPVPIGLLYIAAAQRRFGTVKCEYQLYDFDVPEGDPFSLDRVFSEFEKSLSEFKPDFIALGCLTARQVPYLEKSINISRQYVDDMEPGASIIVGGKPASSEPERYLSAGADVVCIGEGEITFSELVECLAAGDDLAKVNGIMFRGPEGKFIRTPPRSLVVDIDSLPMPAWDLLDMTMLKRRNREVFSPFITSRGCPFGCIYCDHERKYRAHSPGRVTDEIEYLMNHHGFTGFDIMDEIFNCQKKRVFGIRDELKIRDLHVSLYAFDGIRADIVDEETVDAFREMGIRGMSIAVETATPRMQELIGKRLKIERALKMITWSVQRDILVNTFFMVGFPTETREEMEITLSVAKECDTHQATISKVQFIPGTALYKLAIHSGLDPNKYRLEHIDRFGIRKDSGAIEITEYDLNKLVNDALFDVYNHVPRMERICRLLSPVFFSKMYRKFYEEHNLWTHNFAKEFNKAMANKDVDFPTISRLAVEERNKREITF